MDGAGTQCEPLRYHARAEVPGPVPCPWPTRPISLQTTVAGAGRTMGLDEFLAITVSTALLVVVDGVLRDGDTAVLADYDQYGRILGGEPEQLMDTAAAAYVAWPPAAPTPC